MRGYVGVTDDDWYRFLAPRPSLTEINFWRPGGGRGFHALAVGEPFFFKTHYPHNRVVGGGFYSDFAPMRLSEAWELFGEANGAASLEQMRLRIGHYRQTPISRDEDPVIGCLFIRDARFFPADSLAEPPPGFAPNIVQGKGFELSEVTVSSYFEHLLQLLLGAYRLRVSPRLREEFGNGERFYAQAGQVVALPERKPDRPQREFLEWHTDEVFKAS